MNIKDKDVIKEELTEKIEDLIGSDIFLILDINEEDDYVTLVSQYHLPNFPDHYYNTRIGVFVDYDPSSDTYSNFELDNPNCTFTDLPLGVNIVELYNLMYSYVKAELEQL